MLRPNETGSVCSLRSTRSGRSQRSGGRSNSSRNRNELATIVAVRRRIQDQDPGSRLGNGDSPSVKQIVLELGKKLIRFGIKALVFSAVLSIFMVRVIQSSASRRTSMNAAFVVMRPQNVTNYYSVQRKTVADRPPVSFNLSLIGQQGPGLQQQQQGLGIGPSGAQPQGQGLLQNQAGVLGGQQQGVGGGILGGGGAGGLLGTAGGATGGLLSAGGATGGLLGAGAGTGGLLGAGGGGGLLGNGGSAGGLLGEGGGPAGGILGGGVLGAGEPSAGGILGAGGGSSGLLAANGIPNGNLQASSSSQANGVLMGLQQGLATGLNGTSIEQNGQLMSNQGQLIGGQPGQQLGQGLASQGVQQDLQMGQSLNGLQSGGVAATNFSNTTAPGAEIIMGQNMQSNIGGNMGPNQQLGSAASPGLQLGVGSEARLGAGGISSPARGLDASSLGATSNAPNLAGAVGGINNGDGANGNMGQALQEQGLPGQGLQRQGPKGQGIPGQVLPSQGLPGQGLQLVSANKGGQGQQPGQLGMPGQHLGGDGGQEEDTTQTGGRLTSTLGAKNVGASSLKLGGADESLAGMQPDLTEPGSESDKIGDDSSSGGKSGAQLKQLGGVSRGSMEEGAEDAANTNELKSGRGTNSVSTRLASSTTKLQSAGGGKGKLRGTAGQDDADGQDEDAGPATQSSGGGGGKSRQVGNRGSTGVGAQKVSKMRNSGQSSSAVKSRSLDDSNLRGSAGDSDEETSFGNTRSSSKVSGAKGTKKLRGSSGASRSN